MNFENRGQGNGFVSKILALPVTRTHAQKKLDVVALVALVQGKQKCMGPWDSLVKQSSLLVEFEVK